MTNPYQHSATRLMAEIFGDRKKLYGTQYRQSTPKTDFRLLYEREKNDTTYIHLK